MLVTRKEGINHMLTGGLSVLAMKPEENASLGTADGRLLPLHSYWS